MKHWPNNGSSSKSLAFYFFLITTYLKKRREGDNTKNKSFSHQVAQELNITGFSTKILIQCVRELCLQKFPHQMALEWKCAIFQCKISQEKFLMAFGK